MSKRLASFILAYGVLGGLIAPAGIVAQEQPAPDPAQQQEQQQPATTTTAAPAPPTETQAASPPPQPQPQPAVAAPQPAPPQPAPPQPAPKPADPAPVAVASGAGTVTIKDFNFAPASVTVNVGDSVTWANAGPSDHTATASGGSFDTGILRKGRTASRTFSKAGTFGYVCSIHPFMHGTVNVLAASSGGGNQGSSGGGGHSGSGSAGGSSSGSSSGTGATTGSGASLPHTGIDAGGLALWGAGFLLIGLFARRRTA